MWQLYSISITHQRLRGCRHDKARQFMRLLVTPVRMKASVGEFAPRQTTAECVVCATSPHRWRLLSCAAVGPNRAPEISPKVSVCFFCDPTGAVRIVFKHLMHLLAMILYPSLVKWMPSFAVIACSSLILVPVLAMLRQLVVQHVSIT